MFRHKRFFTVIFTGIDCLSANMRHIRNSISKVKVLRNI